MEFLVYTVKYRFSECASDWIGIFIVYRHIRMPTSCSIALFGTRMILHSFIPAFIYYLKQSVRDHVKKQRPICRRDISLVSNPPIGTSFGLQSIHPHYRPRMQPLECFKPIFQKCSELRQSYTIKQS